MNKQELKRLCKGLKVKETGMYTKGYNIGINAVLSTLLSVGNPPLKFEELEVGMWVWDNKLKCYRELCILFEPCKEYPKGSFKSWHDLSQTNKDFVEFDENCFYRREVKENGE